jgi:zinc D-Ala-D-Ala carboxypeptidase
MQLTVHFSLEELIASETAARKGIDNTPPDELMGHLLALASGLEKVRKVLGNKAIHVNSGYRCAALNKAVGGSPKSRHMLGLAADILCPQFGTPLQVCQAIVRAEIPFDQVIHEFGRWCHVAFPAPGTVTPKGETLTIASAATGFRPGLHAVA